MDMAAEAQRLLEHDATWSTLSQAGSDIEGILAYFADDCVVYQPGMPPMVGKDAIREYVTASLATPGFHIEWTPERAVLADDGSMGYTTGTNAVTVPGADDAPMTLRGRFVAVWRRAGDGWQCVEDAMIPAP